MMRAPFPIAGLIFGIATLFGCSGGGGGGGGGGSVPAELDSSVEFSRNRDVTTGEIIPVLAESSTGFDASEVDSPHVVVDSGRPIGDKYLLYYEATNSTGESTIGVVSSDEENFETLTVNRTQAIDLGASGSGFETAATDPTVIVDASIPFGTDGRYRIWFEGRSGASGEISKIITGTSGDGVIWTNFTVCSGLNASFASVRVADPCVIDDGSLLRMWFEGVDATLASGADDGGVIGHADSADGVNWTVRDAAGQTGTAAAPVFGVGPAGSFDAFGVQSPCVVVDPTVAPGEVGRFLLFYEAADLESDTTNTIGLARSANGLSWSDPELPVLRPSSDSIVPLPFDSGDVEHPTAVIDDNVAPTDVGFILLWYTGDGENGASPNRIGLASGRELP